MNLALFQSFGDVTNLLNIQNVSVVGLLLAFCGYLIWQNSKLKDELKEEKGRIDTIRKEHQDIQKEDKQDLVKMVNRYENLVERVIQQPRYHERSRA